MTIILDQVMQYDYIAAMDGPVNVAEAKAHFSSLLDRAANGEEIVIAKGGRPVARLMPLEKRPKRPFGLFSHWPDIPDDVLLAPMSEEDLRWAEGYYSTPDGISLPAKARGRRGPRQKAKPRRK
jgi:prevent-host-death family protein